MLLGYILIYWVLTYFSLIKYLILLNFEITNFFAELLPSANCPVLDCWAALTCHSPYLHLTHTHTVIKFVLPCVLLYHYFRLKGYSKITYTICLRCLNSVLNASVLDSPLLRSISILNLLNRDPRLRVSWAAGSIPSSHPEVCSCCLWSPRASPTWCEARVPPQTLVSLFKEAEYGIEEHDIISLLCGI